MSIIKYVIIQASGRGTRMELMTQNRPKVLLPFGDKTVLESILDEYPEDTHFIVIGDYLLEVIQTYIKILPQTYKITVIHGVGTGNAQGIKKALELVPDNTPFTIRWCDVLSDSIISPRFDTPIELGLSETKCRKTFLQGRIIDTPPNNKDHNGICGIFHLQNKDILSEMPESGEFTDYLSTKQESLSGQYLPTILELGTIEQYSAATHRCIFASKHNHIDTIGDYIVKRATQPAYAAKLKDEVAWYKWVNKRCNNTAELWLDETEEKNCHYSMKLIKGDTLMNMNCSIASRLQILRNAITGLKCLHSLPIPPDQPPLETYKSAAEVMYYCKAVDRVFSVGPLLNQLLDQKWIVVNNKICTNPFVSEESRTKYASLMMGLVSDLRPAVIHGDPTFSNMIVEPHLAVKFIDPRGRFGHIPISGDLRYDFAKLYYSAIENYDYVVSQQFTVDVKPNIGNIQYKLASHNLEFAADEIIAVSGMTKVEMLLLQSSIWFSLCGYITNNIDAIYLAFAKGCEMYHDALKITEKNNAAKNMVY